jgi:hypothetical protein
MQQYELLSTKFRRVGEKIETINAMPPRYSEIRF